MFAAAQQPFKSLSSARSLNREGDYNQYRTDYNLEHAFSKKHDT